VFRLPPLSCDCHAHVFGPFDKFPLPAKPAYVPALVPFPDYVRMLRTIGISRAVLVQPSPYGTDNAAMMAALASGAFPLRGIALIDDATGDRELERLHSRGVQGCRIHLGGRNDEAILASLPRVAARIRPFGWHIQFYMDAARRPDVDRVLLSLPVPVVIDHFAMVPAKDGIRSPGFQTLLRLARSGRCWFKLSAPYRISSLSPRYPDVTPMVHALLEAAPDRCVWGSDWPHPNSDYIPNDGDLVDMLPEWIPDPALQRKVLVDNPAALYGF
jgi:predicted TIM-barrel fold metal-dependent hydrolase